MKHLIQILTISILIMLSNITYSQIGINTNDPDPNVVLHIYSTDKGILIPSLSTPVRLAYGTDTTPLTDGVIVYDNVLQKLFVWRLVDSNWGPPTGSWQYINPWETDGTNLILPLGTANEVTIEGDLNIGGSISVSNANTAFNKNFGGGANDVDRGSNNPDQLITKVYEIGSWDMDTDNACSFSIGDIDASKIVSIDGVIFSDNGWTFPLFLIIVDDNWNSYQRMYINPDNFLFLFRDTDALFDNYQFDSTLVNRGYITISYLP